MNSRFDEENRRKSPVAKSATSTNFSEPLWKTTEFYIYYILVGFAIFEAFYLGYGYSSPDRPHYKEYKHRLSNGWMLGSRPMDTSDAQYSHFQKNMSLLTVFFTCFVIVSRFLTPLPWKRFAHFGCAMVFLIALHGILVLKILILALANYMLARTLKASNLAPLLCWTFNIAVLFLIEFDSPNYSSYLSSLSFMDSWFRGFIPRWNIFFKISTLRLISFAMDFHAAAKESLDATGNNPDHKLLQHAKTCTSCGISKDPCDRARSEISQRYDLITYLAYVFYPPLYLAGPILTYNNYVSQLDNAREESKNLYSFLRYALRFLACYLVMELMLHLVHVVAIKDAKAWGDLSAAELGSLGILNLLVIWFKLMIIWRYFRMIAWADGISTQENMLRCVLNNYSGIMFWRSWHASYNKWIIRYMYIPLGGRSKAHYNVWLVFTFVALWHDLQLRLFAWGWLICLFLLPEFACRYLSKRLGWVNLSYYRHLCAIGGTLNVLMMITANLVGFAVGLDGVQYMWTQILQWKGLGFMVATFAIIFSAVQIMFEVRESEARQNNRKPY